MISVHLLKVFLQDFLKITKILNSHGIDFKLRLKVGRKQSRENKCLQQLINFVCDM